MSTNAEVLKDLITNQVLPEINEVIDDLFAIVADKNHTNEDLEELKQLQQMQKEFKEILADVEAGDMEEEEYIELIASINDMLNGEEDELDHDEDYQDDDEEDDEDGYYDDLDDEDEDEEYEDEEYEDEEY